jgi:hypothetical protein
MVELPCREIQCENRLLSWISYLGPNRTIMEETNAIMDVGKVHGILERYRFVMHVVLSMCSSCPESEMTFSLLNTD